MRMAPRYRRATKKEKSMIVDEYMAITVLKTRKYAIAKLNRYARPHRQRLKIKKTQRRCWAFTEDGRSRMS